MVKIFIALMCCSVATAQVQKAQKKVTVKVTINKSGKQNDTTIVKHSKKITAIIIAKNNKYYEFFKKHI